jgi:hypothetical protein
MKRERERLARRNTELEQRLEKAFANMLLDASVFQNEPDTKALARNLAKKAVAEVFGSGQAGKQPQDPKSKTSTSTPNT